MPEGVFRSAKVLAIIAVAGGVLLAIQLLLAVSVGTYGEGSFEPAIELLVQEWFGTYDVGAVTTFPDGSVAIPFNGNTGAILVIPIVGYQSTIEIAYRIDGNGEIQERRILRSEETPPINRTLATDGVDGLSGATITVDAVRRSDAIARRRGAQIIGESP